MFLKLLIVLFFLSFSLGCDESDKILSPQETNESENFNRSPKRKFEQVLVFGFEEITSPPDTIPDNGLTCFRDVLHFNDSQIEALRNRALKWFKERFGLPYDNSMLVGDILVLPGYGNLVPFRFDTDYRLIASYPHIVGTGVARMIACAYLFFYNFDYKGNYEGEYGDYLRAFNSTTAIAIPTFFVYGRYSLNFPSCTLNSPFCSPDGHQEQIEYGSHFPGEIDHTRWENERDILFESVWGRGYLMGSAQNVHLSDGRNSHHGRAVWTFDNDKIIPQPTNVAPLNLPQ